MWPKCGPRSKTHPTRAPLPKQKPRLSISAGFTESQALTLGVARLPPGGTLYAHRHEQPELYLVLDGAGVVTIDGSSRVVGQGASVFIPGNAVHSVQSTGGTDLRVAYVFAADAFEDVEYVFGV